LVEDGAGERLQAAAAMTAAIAPSRKNAHLTRPIESPDLSCRISSEAAEKLPSRVETRLAASVPQAQQI
jgi:hypothetical protein